jgi:hypothetical protein
MNKTQNESLGILEQIKQDFEGALIKGGSFTSYGCSVNFGGLEGFVAFSVDDLCKNPRLDKILSDLRSEPKQQKPNICDCIIYQSEAMMTVGIIELKSGEPDADEVIAQLRNGARIALYILEGVKSKFIKLDFYLIVLHGKGWNSSEIRMISKQSIPIKGIKYEINTDRCGAIFTEIVNELKKKREKKAKKSSKKRR